MDKLTIPPLWASLALMAIRYVVVGVGLVDAAKAGAVAGQVLDAALIIGGLLWALWAKLRSHAQKKALAVADPRTVTLPDGRTASALRVLLPFMVIALGALVLASQLTACAGASGLVTRPVAAAVAARSGGLLEPAGDTARLSLTAARTAAYVQVDAAGALKLSQRAFLAADDAGAFWRAPDLKLSLQVLLGQALDAYRALRRLGRAATANEVAVQRRLLTEALTAVNQALHVDVPAAPPSAG